MRSLGQLFKRSGEESMTAKAKGECGFGLYLFRPVHPLRATLLCILISGSLVARSQSDAPSRQFLVAIKEGQMDLSRSGGTSSDCILVLPDGRFHLERRKQQISRTASLTIFEASLDQERLASLQAILADKQLTTLPPDVEPKFPIGGSWFRGVEVQIPRDNGIQKVGYFRLPDEQPPRSYTSEEVKAWEVSALRLKPLVDWFHNVENWNLAPTKVPQTHCRIGSED